MKKNPLSTTNYQLSTNTGFTFIEIMISVTILGLIILAVGGLLDKGVADWSQGEVKAEAQQNMRIAMERISRDIRPAVAVLGSSNANHLVLKYADNSEVHYYLDNISVWGPGSLQGKVLQRQETKNTAVDTKPQANYLNSLEFSFAPPGSVTNSEHVTIKLSSRLPNGEILTSQTGATLRGKFLPRR